MAKRSLEEIAASISTSLQNVRELREYLSTQDRKALEYYGQSAGSFLLARDMKARGKIKRMNLEHLSELLKNEERLEGLIGENAQGIRWKPRHIDLRFEDAEEIVDYLKKFYRDSSDKFFEKYGSKNGALNLANDLRNIGLDLNIRKVYSMIAEPLVVSTILDISDPRFERNWNPRVMYADTDKAKLVLNHLKRRYEQDSDNFFEVYGSVLGSVVLSKELQQNHGIDLSPSGISSIIRDGRALEESLGITDIRFKREWGPKNIDSTLENLDLVLGFLKDKYLESEDEFFTKYGSSTGALILSKDLKKEKNLDIGPDRLHTFVGKGSLLSTLLNIQDERFEVWDQQKIGGNVTLIDVAIELLRETYAKSKDEIFCAYGSPEGMFYFASDLREQKGFDKRINLHDLSATFGKPSRVQQVTRLRDPRFESEWQPRDMNIHLDTLESVIDFLADEYHFSPRLFFEKYGNRAGTYRLAKDLKKKNIEVHLQRLGTVVNDPEAIQRLILGQDEDPLFKTQWKPRSFTLSLNEIDEVLQFLRQKYDQNSDEFFSQYGSEAGQLILGRDLEANLKRRVTYLQSITGNGEVLSDLLEIDDPRFSSEWNTKVLMNLTHDRLELLLDFLKNKYKENSREFFETYGRQSGLIDIARDFYAEKGFEVRLDALCTIAANGTRLASYLNIEDAKFETSWKPKWFRGKFTDIEKTLGYLRKKINENVEEFVQMYGTRQGLVELAAEIESARGITSDIHTLSLLMNPVLLREQLGVNYEILHDRDTSMPDLSVKTMIKIVDFLKERYTENSESFFGLYGSRVGKLILAKEIGLSELNKSAFSLFGNGTAIADLLGIKDDRFQSRWHSKMSNQFEELAIRGITYLTEGKKLPELDSPIEDNIVEYLNFRSNILRGLLRGGGAGGYTIDHALNKETIMHLVELCAPQHVPSVSQFIDASIQDDKKTLEGLASYSISQFGNANAPSSTQYSSADRYAGKRGRKGYSKEELIEIGRQSGITTTTEWQGTKGLPGYMTIIRHFGSWPTFMDAVQEDGFEREEIPIEYVPSATKNNNDISEEEFGFRAGRLLYSFDPEIRQNGYGLLLELGSRTSKKYQKLLKNTNLADMAQDLFQRAVARYDPYLGMREGEAKIVPLANWVGAHLKYTKHVLHQQQHKHGKHISIETDGLANPYEGPKPLSGFE